MFQQNEKRMKQGFWSMLLLLACSCSNDFYVVYPVIETTPVESIDDAADDIAIFTHPIDPSKQAIIGTNKQKGLVVYDNQGKLVHNYPFGLINNVDLRQDVKWGEESITIVGASNRSDNSIVFYRLNESTLELSPLHEDPIISQVNEVYGFCMYQGDACYAFVVGKDGVVEQWMLQPNNKQHVSAKMVRSFDVGGQCEGLVADDELGYLYVGEEEMGVWRYGAKPDAGKTRTNICLIKENPNLKADIEGVTIYTQPNGAGYLIISSQGNNSYAVFERQEGNKYLGSFKIDANEQIGGTSDTDGIDVTSVPFANYPRGVFIAQDGDNGRFNQNFKVVDVREIEKGIAAWKSQEAITKR